MGRRKWFRGMAILGGVVASAVMIFAACGYVALPGGLVFNFAGLPGSQKDPIAEESLRSRVSLPEGFTIETWAAGIPNARLLLVTEKGDLLVSAPRNGKVFLIEHDANGDGASDGTRVLLDGLDRPHGLAIKGRHLFIAEGSAIVRVSFDPHERAVGVPERIVEGLPQGENHWTRTVHVGPDDKLYVSIGSSCNVCEETDPRRAAIVRYDLNGTNEELFATGLRNAVDFTWRPATGAMYATDNGRDLLGDDFPPEEINHVVEGGFYGWPYANPPRVPDPDFGALRPDKVAASIAPVHLLPAHTAPMAIQFYEADLFPERYRGAAFVALHGSWNRREKQGYEVVVLFFDSDGEITREAFLEGFEIDEDVVGRPVGLAVGHDGALYVSDDYTGSVYRVAYGEGQVGGLAAPRVSERGDPLAGVSPEERSRAAAAGSKLWDEGDCARCHVRGEAGSQPRVLKDLRARFDLADLERFLATPQPPMPLYPFTKEQRRDVAIYLLLHY